MAPVNLPDNIIFPEPEPVVTEYRIEVVYTGALDKCLSLVERTADGYGFTVDLRVRNGGQQASVTITSEFRGSFGEVLQNLNGIHGAAQELGLYVA